MTAGARVSSSLATNRNTRAWKKKRTDRLGEIPRASPVIGRGGRTRWSRRVWTTREAGARSSHAVARAVDFAEQCRVVAFDCGSS